MVLKNGLCLRFGDFSSNDPTCGAGDLCDVEIVDVDDAVVWRGVTCPCGRGCGGADCVRDDWERHDTDIEPFRAA